MHSPFDTFRIHLSWIELAKRTVRDFIADDCLSLAAQLAYYFFLALFPALLFLLAFASFFSLSSIADQVVSVLAPFAPPDVLGIITEQMQRISDADHGGILTLGFVGALWSSSAALVSIVDSLNAAYDIDEARPWWKVRLVAVGLTVGLAVLVVVSFGLVLVGPALAETIARELGLGPVFEWTWKIAQWPIAYALVVSGVGLVYYFGPDAEQSWEWITPGAVLATGLWLAVSLAFRYYIEHFTDYNAVYGTVGGVIVLLLWFYLSGVALLIGAEMNAEIEHASPHGKPPGERVPGERKKIGRLAAEAYAKRQREVPAGSLSASLSPVSSL